MHKAAAIAALVAGAVAAPLWPGLAWAAPARGGPPFYPPGPPPVVPPPNTGGGHGPSTVGHQGGANDDLPPMTTTTDRPAAGNPVTVGLGSSNCTQALSVWVTPPNSTPPTQFGPSNPSMDSGTGGFSVTGNAPSSPGTYVIYATCQDASGTPYVYTVTIVVPGNPAQNGVRAAAVNAAVPGATSRSSSAGPSAPASSGGTGTWTPPADWSTPQVRALVAQAVNSAFADAPPAVSFGAQPVVAHAVPPTHAPSSVPWRDGTEALVAGLAAVSLLKLSRRHRPSSRMAHKGGRF